MNCGGNNFCQSREILDRTGHTQHDFISMPAKLNSTRSSSCSLHDIVHDEPPERNSSVDDCCRVRSYVFVNKQRQRNLYGKFLRIFEEADDCLSGALCDTCHKRLESIWKKKVVICHFSKALVEKETYPLSFDIEARRLMHKLLVTLTWKKVIEFPLKMY